MKHVFWVYDNELAGRPGPGIAPWQLSELKAGGFDMILSLASDLYPHSDASQAGLSRTCIPLPDVPGPDDYLVRACAASLPLTLLLALCELVHPPGVIGELPQVGPLGEGLDHYACQLVLNGRSVFEQTLKFLSNESGKFFSGDGRHRTPPLQSLYRHRGRHRLWVIWHLIISYSRGKIKQTNKAGSCL